jgi:hypothetical protein
MLIILCAALLFGALLAAVFAHSGARFFIAAISLCQVVLVILSLCVSNGLAMAGFIFFASSIVAFVVFIALALLTGRPRLRAQSFEDVEKHSTLA